MRDRKDESPRFRARGRDHRCDAGLVADVAFDAERDGVVLSGYAGLPTLNRGSAQAQYLFVNGRPVRDRMLAGAVRGAATCTLLPPVRGGNL